MAQMQTIATSVVVQCPVEDVFAFVTNARNNPLWQSASGLKAIQQEPDNPVGVGTRITETRSFMGRDIENCSEVTEYEPNRRYVRTQIGDGGPIMQGEYTFEPVAAGTRWTSVIHIQANDSFAIAASMLADRLQQSTETGMAEAKALLERRVVENAR